MPLADTVLERLHRAEQNFSFNEYKGHPNTPCMVEKYGDLPILLSAPHAVRQIRAEQPKAHEFYTGALATCLAQDVGCSCICKKYLRENTANDDPNTDGPDCAYKTAVRQFMQTQKICLFVDIHGLSGKRDSIIDIGIDHGRNVNDMNAVLGLQNAVNQTFGADKGTIDKYFSAFAANIMSKWVHNTFNITALQLEINGAYRWFADNNTQQSLDLYFCLQNWLKNLPLAHRAV